MGVRQAERVGLDEELHERRDEDLKEDPDQLEAVGAVQRFVSEDDVKGVLGAYAEVLAIIILAISRHHVGDGVVEQGRTVERRGGSFGSASEAHPMASRVMATIGLKMQWKRPHA